MMAFWRFKWQTFELGGFAPRLLRSDSTSAAPTLGDGPPPADHSGGDKILLPSEVLEAVMGASPEQTESPLTFSLTCGSTRCFCGVIEFTSPAGTVTLPPAVVDALGLHLTDQVSSATRLARVSASANHAASHLRSWMTQSSSRCGACSFHVRRQCDSSLLTPRSGVLSISVSSMQCWWPGCHAS